MRKIIDGKLYDTDTAYKICDIGPRGYSRTDFHWEDTQLWRTNRGAYFIAGEGGALSRWRESAGLGNWQGGEGLELISEDDAKDLIARNSTVETYISCFGEPEEG